MDAKDIRNIQEAYNQVYQVDESSIANRARNAVADQRLSAAQSSTQKSVDRLRSMPTVTRATAALAARNVERDVKTSSNYGPQRPKPGTVTGRLIQDPKPTSSKPEGSKIKKPKPTGSAPRGSRITGASSSLSGTGSASGTGRFTPGSGGRYGISGIGLADEYDLYDIILSHLLDEGYADTEQAASVIMVNMSEEWKDSILK